MIRRSPASRPRLADRGCTVFGGHWHQAGHRTRYGRDYVRLGTTGGRPQGGGEARDELIWVSMGNGTPRIARLGVDGIGSVTPGTTPQPAGPGPELQAP